ncbi:hypothetical protein Phum_PHUM067010 [Pediculus humanus corporis]|uniref:Uncharacterized protein n=1 Tax=Pediculus humanus subsp. corporis TaxID=121224 RepID=E0VBR2_PEDHC|nr:uncharacterized protein Phum_PHUM067010 [Pediculus humanus corporis]EEB10818.1 hypothetical protein Phum_PHUM067010 [Pediculus humanus corporis]
MRQKKKIDNTKVETMEKPEACVKCSKMQNGRNCTFENEQQTDGGQTKQQTSTLSTLKSVLKRTTSHKKDKVSKNSTTTTNDKISSGSKEISTTNNSKKNKNRVQFDETQNKYFEADYVILIHEEDYDLDDYYDEGSPFDDEDDDVYDEGMIPPKICCSNPNCNNTITLSNYGYLPPNGTLDVGSGSYHRVPDDRERLDFLTHYYDGHYREINQNDTMRKYNNPTTVTVRCENDKCKNCYNYFDFDMSCLKSDQGSQDFSDQVTLSPPEGYKDGGSHQCCPHHHHHHGSHFHTAINEPTHPHKISSSSSSSSVNKTPIELQQNDEIINTSSRLNLF